MELKEYELAGIETIARGVCVRDGKLLLCRAKGGSSTYLPGGQHGKPHAEINLVYELKLGAEGGVLPPLNAQEDWIEFEWCDLNRLDEANLLPPAFRSLSAWPDVRFEC